MECRFCNTQVRHLFLSLGAAPLSNSYLTGEDLQKMEPHYPLDVYVCHNCLLVQLEEFEKAQDIFHAGYAYFSSYSDSWLKHCENYVDMMVERFGLNEAKFVVEIASNDGYLLQYFKKYNVPILGIEPAANTARVAREKGIPTEISFFDQVYAQGMLRAGRQADLIIGNNVLAHNPNLNDFVRGLKTALKPDGLITMEFPHLARLMEETQFDTIYHEHFSYFSFTTVEKVFARHGITLFDVEELPSHGGSLRIFGRHAANAAHPVTPRVAALKQKEAEAGLLGMEAYRKFAEQVRETKRKLLSFLIEAKRSGKRIVGYGAPAKGNTLLNFCGVYTDFIDYTVDRSPHKQNHLLPGTRIPIHGPEKIAETKPDYVLILPWNLKDEISRQMAHIREWGGKFVVPIPEVQIF